MSLPARHIPLEGGSNFRDFGGYVAADGRRIKWGRVYRSAALSRLSAADWDGVARLNILSVCDLRSREERAMAPTVWRGGSQTRQVGEAYDAHPLFQPLINGAQRAALGDMSQAVYPIFATVLAQSFRQLFAALVAGEGPVLVHCAAGQDRTGLAVALVLTALDVSFDQILEDYSLSTALRVVENEMDYATVAAVADDNFVARYYLDRLAKSGELAFRARPLVTRQGEPLLTVGLRSIEQKWGSILGYLEQELAVGSQEIARLRDNLLET